MKHAFGRLAPHRRSRRLSRPGRGIPALAPGPAHHAADRDRVTAHTGGGRVRGRSSRLRPAGASGRGPCHLLPQTARPPEPHPLTPEHADTLAARLAGLGHELPGVSAEHSTATAFAEAWQRHTGATSTPRAYRIRLYRLGTLTPPKPLPEGRGRVAGEQDLEHIMRWCREFATAVGEAVSIDAGSWAAHASPTSATRSGRLRTALPYPWRA